jgi:hypothetical protein
MTKDELRAALSAIDAELAAAEAAAEPARAALKPFQDAIYAIEDRREVLLEDNFAAIYGRCDDCGTVIFEGDLAFPASDEVGPWCSKCAPTLGDVLENNEAAISAGDDDDGRLTQSVEAIRSRIANGESPDDKVLYKV